MIVYKITEINTNTFVLRETDQGLYREVVDFANCMESGNKIIIEVIDIEREEFNKQARWDNL